MDHRYQWLRGSAQHRDAKPSAEIGIREVDSFLIGGSHGQRGDGSVKVPLLKAKEESLEVIIVFAPLDLKAERSGDLFEELDAETAPVPIVSMDGKWWAMHGAHYKSCS